MSAIITYFDVFSGGDLAYNVSLDFHRGYIIDGCLSAVKAIVYSPFSRGRSSAALKDARQNFNEARKERAWFKNNYPVLLQPLL
jgi:hypothetical protein